MSLHELGEDEAKENGCLLRVWLVLLGVVNYIKYHITGERGERNTGSSL